MTDAKERRAKRNPRNNKERAWKIAVNPSEYSKTDRKLLLTRGAESYEANTGGLLEDVSQLLANILDRKTRDEIIKDPPAYIDQPGRMALVMATASVLVRKHKAIQKDPRKPLLHIKIREYYMNQLFAARRHAEHGGIVRLEMGRVVYGRDQEDEYGPPAGEPVEGITSLDGVSGNYYKIPLTHANRQCEARAGNDRNGDLLAFIKGPYVYVPESDVVEKYKEYFSGRSGTAYKLEEALKNSVDTETLDDWFDGLGAMNDRLSELINDGSTGVIFKERRYPAKLEAILRAVEAVDEDIAKLGDPLTAKQIYNAAGSYASDSDIDWVVDRLDGIQSPSAVATTLSQYAHDDDIPHVEVTNRDGQPDLYELEYKVGSSKKVDVTEIEDLMEIPCMANLHESLQESKPVRWELYTFVRYLFEVHTADFDVEDIKQWFSQYDWYRADVSEYQVKYEREQVMGDGDPPLPISCSNDNRNWAEHCIGRENCEYSLWRSVELNPDVYERVGGN